MSPNTFLLTQTFIFLGNDIKKTTTLGSSQTKIPFLVLSPAPGWQPRYFVLENGILSYYDSQDDVGKGSKGSIKMAVCEIKGKAA